jgi:hypothetical protein
VFRTDESISKSPRFNSSSLARAKIDRELDPRRNHVNGIRLDTQPAGVATAASASARERFQLTDDFRHPAEIAVGIAAEIIAVCRGVADRPAGPMRLTADQIERPSSPGAEHV